MTDDPTVAATEPSVEGPPSLAGVSYRIGELIGRGGMGEVVVAHDPDIGRDVALKRMRGSAPELVERFLREAKIQARLDHPAIVPVHELGRDSGGMPYFTMKRVTGTTLAARIEAGTETVQRLLRAFVEVCQAIDFAHARGVVHRDLKPSNIMLGDYGEVYVLDWGVARVLAESESLPTPQPLPTGNGSVTTEAGAILGTPGYMAPEQLEGERVGVAADVYALGAILFEILTGEPLHQRAGAMASTLESAAQSPAARRPDRAIAPELDAACIAALARDPAARPTTRELADRIQRFLDGDRDLERRRALATEQVAAARTARTEGRRSDAIRAAGRALALDPGMVEAGELVAELVTEMPKELPPEVVASLAEVERDMLRARSWQSMFAYLAIWLIAPFIPLMHVASWPLLAGVYVSATAIGLLHGLNARTTRVPTWAFMVMNLGLTVLFAQWVGALLMTPLFILALVVALGSRPTLARRPVIVMGWGLVALFLPIALERVGLLHPTFSFGPSGLTSWGNIVTSRGGVDLAMVFVGVGGLLLLTARFALGLTRSRLEAQRHVHVQAWQLRQLLPRNRTAA